MKGYLIIDVGTGNLRVAVCDTDENILSIARQDIQYTNDKAYPNAQYFQPEEVWRDIIELSKKTIVEAQSKNIELQIIACTSTSQREGIVLIGQDGEDIIGLPNHDHRGREWESSIPDSEVVYEKSGRKVSSLFSALKIKGIQERYPNYIDQLAYFTSISDWVNYKFSGKIGYEHSQASETNLYDVSRKKWDPELSEAFGIPEKYLPRLVNAGDKIGEIQTEVCKDMGLQGPIQVLVGGADTQMAINSTEPNLNDLVIVAGTTTPIVKVKDVYKLDQKQRTWTNSHLFGQQYILEVNAGVTGLNLQRLKEFFYPNEPYEVMEEELYNASSDSIVASLGSLICSETASLNLGGFIFKTPINHELTRANFIISALYDMAFSIKENLDVLLEIEETQTDFIWLCGGGAQGLLFKQVLADVLQYDLRIRSGFRQASVNGAVKLCNRFLGIKATKMREGYEVIHWNQRDDLPKLYDRWKTVRKNFKSLQ